jgi:glycosyltransferase involved in cell wall biosynthesis
VRELHCRRAGVKVIFFANTDWYLYNFRLPLAKYLRAQKFDVVMLSPDGPYGALLEQEGFRWLPLEMDRRSLNPARELALIRRISAIYANEKPDIVHHFTIKCVVYGSLIARWHGIPKRINAVTGLGHVFSDSGVRARVLRPLVRSLMRVALKGRGSRLIVQNGDDLAAFVSGGIVAAQETHVIRGSGVDTERFQPVMLEHERPFTRVLLASRLLWDKGIHEYIDAARRVQTRDVPVKFFLAGTPDTGNPASVPISQVDEWHRTGLVTYLGHIDDMPQLLKGMDVVVLPSYREGTPKTLLEAAACALPIITTDVPGCREVVKDGVNGLLVPARDSDALAAAICKLCADPDARRRMGIAGREKVLQDFAQERVLEETFAVYRQLLSAAV